MYQNFKFREPSAQPFHVKDFIYHKEVIGQMDEDICVKMFIAALFIFLKNWKHSQYPTVENKVRKLYDSHTMACLLPNCCQR